MFTLPAQHRTPSLLTIFLTVFVDLVGFGIVLPLLQFIGKEHGAGGVEIGVMIASYSLMQFVFAPAWGRLSDKIGRRPVLLISLVGSVLSYALFATADSLGWLVASRALAGVCGANVAVAQAYIADITHPDKRSKGMGMIGMAFGLGFILGPVIGGVALSAGGGYAMAGWIACGLCAVNAAMAFWCLPESLPLEKRGRGTSTGFLSGWDKARRSPLLMQLLAVAFLSNLAFTIWETTYGIWLNRAPAYGFAAHQYSYVLAYVGFVVAMVQGGLIGRLSKKYGESKLLRVSNVMMLAANILIPFCIGLPALLGVLAVLALGNGLSRPSLYGWVSMNCNDNEQGEMLGLVQSASSLARILGPPAGGLLLDWHYDAPYWLCAAALAMASVVLIGAGSTKPRVPETPKSAV